VPINLDKTVGQLLEDFELLIREKEAKVPVDDLPAFVGIPFQIGLLFFNLLSNALKFTDKEPLIEISGGLYHLSATLVWAIPTSQRHMRRFG